MPDWYQILNEINASGSIYDVTRRQYLKKLQKVTGRNIIIYYSGWLQKQGVKGTEINDEDKNGFMTVIHKLDRTKGLDLLLHTPGGEFAATESLVDYLRSMFGGDIRAIVPQLAMSGGTMIACACKEIVMGAQSSLGPIDPQLGGIPAHGVVEEFSRAVDEVTKNPASTPIWQQIVAKYKPAFIGECEKAIAWSNEMTAEWLRSCMLKDDPECQEKIDRILLEMGDHSYTKSHARHLSMKKCKEMGLNVSVLEEKETLQDAVLSVHHACMLTFSATPAIKVIENHKGIAFIKIMRSVVIPGGLPSGSLDN
jgi:ATP-dependent protease ClpP protease subunit